MGFDDRNLTFAGAGPVGAGTPWGTIGEIVARLITPRGFEVTIETRSSQMNNARYVADGRADLGATHVTQLRGAYEGSHDWAPEGPRPNLRVLANVEHPSWLGIALRNGSGIEDLADIARNEIPARVRASSVRMCRIVCEHYGLDSEQLESWGGYLKAPSDYPHEESDFMSTKGYSRVPWAEEGDFDVIIDTIYAAYTPEARHFTEAAILHELRFVPVPEELQQAIVDDGLGEAAPLPHKLVRGIFEDVPSVIRFPHVIYTRDDAPAASVSEIVETIDRGREAFSKVHIPYRIDPLSIARDHGVPFHPAALAYYEKMGYFR